METGGSRVWNTIVQVGLPGLTTASFFLTSAKLPQWGVVVGLAAQIFWLYSSYRAWKEANQLGIFINTIIVTLVLAYGVINYWLL